MVDTVHQIHISAAKDLHNTSLQLHKSQSLVMVRLVSKDCHTVAAMEHQINKKQIVFLKS